MSSSIGRTDKSRMVKEILEVLGFDRVKQNYVYDK